MYIGSKEGEHLELAEDLQDHLEYYLYVSLQHHKMQCQCVRACLRLVCLHLQTYNVDIAMWAHVHCYQRTCPVYQGECVDGAPIHTVIGMGGRDLAQGAMP